MDTPNCPAPTRNAFRRGLLAWYDRHRRDLPWRRTRDPYAIAVSEFMLQQTQVATVLPYYARWLERFPTWRALAEAAEQDVLKAWEGLGYYRRARNLHKLARAVVALPGACLPADVDALEALPGVGPYTARAIGSIAFGLPVAVLDGNVMRVLTRVFALDGDIATGPVKKKLWALAGELVAPRRSGDWNQAIMELGATVCTPRKPQCLLCPLAKVCEARLDQPERFPVKARAKSVEHAETIAILRRDKTWWCEPTPEGGRLENLWRFPHADPAAMELGEELARLRYGITKYRVTLTAVAARWKRGRVPAAAKARGRWLDATEIAALPFAAPHRKLANKLL